MPCTLLSNADVTGKLVARHPILAVGNHPNCHHPLIQTERGVLENCPHLEAELLLAAVALPNLPSLDKGVSLGGATGARDYAIGKSKIEGVLESTVGIGEEDDCLLKCMRGLHIENVPFFFTCVRYVISEIVYGAAGVARNPARRSQRRIA